MRTVRKIIVATGLFVLCLAITAGILAHLFEDELTGYVVEGLNKQIRTEAKVGNIKLSFIKKFPDASIEFTDVYVSSVPDFRPGDFGEGITDTLLFAEQLFLRFDVIRLIRREYLIREVQFRKGKLNLYVDGDGEGNYRFWNKQEEAQDKAFLLELENVNMEDVSVQFDNRALDISMNGEINRSYFRGKFSQDSFSMSAGLDGRLGRYSNGPTVFFQDQVISSEASLLIDPQTIKIDRGRIGIGGQKLAVTGALHRPAPLELDLSFEAEKLNLESILQHFIPGNGRVPDDLRAGGDLDLRGNIKGTLSNTSMPWIEAEFSIRDGWAESSKYPKSIHELTTGGRYSNGIKRGPATTLIQLSGLSMRVGNSRIGGDYSMFNLLNPDFNYKIKTDLDLSDIQAFILSDSIISEMSGRVLAEIAMRGDNALFTDLEKTDLLDYTYDASLRFEDVSVKPGNLPFEFRNFTGDAIFTDHMEIQSMSGEFANSYISVSGRVDNFLEFLLTPEGNLWMDADIYSERLDLNHLRSFNARRDKIGQPDSVFLPDRLYLKTRFWFDELEINNFKAEQITGNMIYKPGRLSVNNIELLSMDGRIVAEGILEQQQDRHFLVKSISKLTSVNITEGFRSFNNFGQEFILDRHLNGALSGTVNFSSGLNEKMKVKKETVLADCDVVIRDGELKGFEPMLKLSRYIDVEELENIRFSTLTNEIFIRNSEVVIPGMDISSSAADISASGLHGFDKHFTYKMKVALSELRSRRSERILAQESEFGIIEDDGLGKVFVYLIVEGSPDGTNVRYDRRGAVQNVREQMREEKQELREILKEEFGFFKKDTGGQVGEPQKDTPEFIISWDEEPDTNTGFTGKPDNKSDKDRFIIVWDEEEPKIDSVVENKTRRRRKRKK